jgi:L-lysine exporter family protein LysE/ArgO
MPPDLLPLLVTGLTLGIGAAAPIGPVNVEIARRTLKFGPRAGFLLGCGAVTVDVAYAAATSVAMVPVLQYPRAMRAMSVAAAIFLTYLGLLCLRSAWRGHGSDGGSTDGVTGGRDGDGRREGGSGGIDGGDAVPAGRRHYLTGLLMTALNPMTLMFWFVAVPGAAARPGVGLAPVALGVFLGALAWVAFFTTLVGRLRAFGGQRWLAWIDLAGGLTLLTFAGHAIWRLIRPPL